MLISRKWFSVRAGDRLISYMDPKTMLTTNKTYLYRAERVAFVCSLFVALSAVTDLQAQQLFSVNNAPLSQAQQNALAELSKDRVTPASMQTAPFEISLQATDGSALILKNEQNGATVVLSNFAKDINEITITPILIAELKNAALGEGSDFTCNLVNGLGKGTLSLVDTVAFTLNKEVTLPTFEYADKGSIKQSTTNDRKLVGVTLSRPSLLPTNNDPKTLKAVEIEADKYATYVYLYELPNGDVTTWVEKDPFLSMGGEIEPAAIKTVDVGVEGGLPFTLTTDNLTEEQQACAVGILEDLSAHLQGEASVRVYMGFERMGAGVLGGSSILSGRQLDGSDWLYVSSLYNNLVGGQVFDTDGYDIIIHYNTAYEDEFYYGLERACPATKIDFFSVVEHEVMHGLGFASDIYNESADYLYNRPFVYDIFLSYNGQKLVENNQNFRAKAIVSGNLIWIGESVKKVVGREPKMFAPAVFNPGSSVGHWDDSETFTTLMHWSVGDGEMNYLGEADLALMQDIGWTISDDSRVSEDGFVYVISKGAIKIIGYQGKASDLVVPSQLEGKDVITIGAAAFMGNKTIKNIAISDTVTTLGDSVFKESAIETITLGSAVKKIGSRWVANAKSLANIYVSEFSENYSSIEGVLFNDSASVICQYPGGRADVAYYIPDSVTEVAAEAFMGSNLQSIYLSSNVATLGDGWISGSTSLSEIVVDPENQVYQSIDGALLNKSGSTLVRVPEGVEGEFIVPENVKTIGNACFASCKKITNVEMADTVRRLDSDSFCYCTNLERLSLGSALTTIGAYAFYGDNKLSALYFYGPTPTVSNYAFIGLPMDDDGNIATVAYYAKGAKGWTNPWKGLKTEAMIINPTISGSVVDGMLVLDFEGVLYSSDDLQTWTKVVGAKSPLTVKLDAAKRFYRTAGE